MPKSPDQEKSEVARGHSRARLGRWAQGALRALCNPDIGCSPPAEGEDRHGWDYLMEWGDHLAEGQGEKRLESLRRSCFAQVKGTRGKGVELNPLTFRHMLTEPRPVFIIIMVPLPGEDLALSHMWVIHVDERIADAIRRNLWQRHVGLRAASKIDIPVSWGRRLEQPTLATFRALLEEYVPSDPSQYENAKLVGESGAIVTRGNITWDLGEDPVKAVESLVDFELGIREFLPAKHVQIEEVRYGIPSTTFQATRELAIKLEKHAEINTMLRIVPSRDDLHPLELKGTARIAMGFCGLNERNAPRGFRFSNERIELLVKDGHPAELRTKPPGWKDTVSIEEGIDYARLLRLLELGSGDSLLFELHLPGTEDWLEAGTQALAPAVPPPAWHSALLQSWENLRTLAALADIPFSRRLPWGLVLAQKDQLRLLAELTKRGNQLGMHLETGAADQGEAIRCVDVRSVSLETVILVVSFAITGEADILPDCINIEPAEVTSVKFEIVRGSDWNLARYMRILNRYLESQHEQYPHDKIIVQPEVQKLLDGDQE